MYCTQREKPKTRRKIKKEILYLNIKAKWFNRIWAGIKTREYRDKTSYYDSRIGRKLHSIRYIWFMNGMNTNANQMLVEFNGLDDQDLYSNYQYVLKLGNIVSVDTHEIDRLITDKYVN
jgi:hypothetical protein